MQYGFSKAELSMIERAIENKQVCWPDTPIGKQMSIP